MLLLFHAIHLYRTLFWPAKSVGVLKLRSTDFRQWLNSSRSQLRKMRAVSAGAIALGGGLVIGGAVAAAQKIQSHLDWVIVSVAFLFGTLIMYLGARLRLAENARFHAPVPHTATGTGNEGTVAEAARRAPNLELVSAQPEVPSPEQIAKLKWKRKLRAVLINREDRDIDVCAPDWISKRGFVPFQHPFWSIVRLENKDAGGWRQDQWKNEGNRVTVPPGHAVQVSVGLNDSLTVDDIKERLKTASVGTLVVPVYISGAEREWRKDL